MRACVWVMFCLLWVGCSDDDAPRTDQPNLSAHPAGSTATTDDTVAEERTPAATDEALEEGATPADTPAVRVIAIDTHVDTTQRMLDHGDNIAEALSGGHLDLPRMRAGGLTGAFLAFG